MTERDEGTTSVDEAKPMISICNHTLDMQERLQPYQCVIQPPEFELRGHGMQKFTPAIFMTYGHVLKLEEPLLIKRHTSKCLKPSISHTEITVISKPEGEWEIKFDASESKVGSHAEGISTRTRDSHSYTDEVTKRCMEKTIKDIGKHSKIKPVTLDYDTMYTISDVNISNSKPEKEEDGRRGECNDYHMYQAGSMWWFHKPDDNKKLEVFLEISQNPGYCKLKVESKAFTRNQQKLLFLFKKSEEGHLKRPNPNIIKDLIASWAQKFNFKLHVVIQVQEPKYKIQMFLNGKSEVGMEGNNDRNDIVYVVSLDWVLCLKVHEWPEQAEEWASRKRSSGWPDKQMVADIVKQGCHVIPKAHPNNPDDETEWRLSFSEAERSLLRPLPEAVKSCYRMVKTVAELQCRVLTEEKEHCLSSYVMKNVLLWELEEVEITTWEKNPEERFLALFGRLAVALKKRNMPWYFIPEVNLIGHINEKVIQGYLETVTQIMQDPVVFLKETWDIILEPKLGRTFQQVFGQLMKADERDDESWDIAKSRSLLNVALVLKDYACKETVKAISFGAKLTEAIYANQTLMANGLDSIENDTQMTEAAATDMTDNPEENHSLKIVKQFLEESLQLVIKYTEKPAVRTGILMDAHFLSGKVGYIEGRVDDARASFEKALQIVKAEGCKLPARAMSRILMDYGKCLAASEVSKGGDVSVEAVTQLFDRALALDASNREVLVCKVLLLHRSGRKEQVEEIIKDCVGYEKTTEKKQKKERLVQEKPQDYLVPCCRGDLAMLDEVMCSELKTTLNWSGKVQRAPNYALSNGAPMLYIPDTVIFSHLYLKGQNITKTTLNDPLKPFVKLLAEAGTTGEAQGRYVANSLLGSIYYTAGNYGEAIKLLHAGAKMTLGGCCSERVTAHLAMLKTLVEIRTELVSI